ncbi:MAG: hypothetical protein CL780_03730 [Chloroflexi bacterium]|nr:hypothetical protein [Chloroflexota bacterium]
MTTSTDLHGKVAFITGAARGIGQGIAEILSERGAILAVCDLDKKDFLNLEKSVSDNGKEIILGSVDVTNQDSIKTFVDKVIDQYGKIDICVPNAGVIGSKGFENRKNFIDEDWESTWGVNVKGVVNTVEAVKGDMISKESGKIVIIASHGGRKPRGVGEKGRGTGQHPYMVSKAAAIQYMHQMAIDLGRYNINVNAVCPGRLWTSIWESIAINHKETNPDYADYSPYEIFLELIKGYMPLGRPQTPHHIGKTVAFLSSDDASKITGQAINVNGGAILN